MATKVHFRTAVGIAAVRLQILERALKVYLKSCFDIIRANVPGFYFDYREKDIKNLPLGRLTHMFKKYNSNVDIHKKLEGLREKRNYIAHNAYMAFSGDANPDPVLVDAEIKRINDISDEADEVAEKILDESDKIFARYSRGHLTGPKSDN